MADVKCYRSYLAGLAVPPRGTVYFPLGPNNVLGTGAITVTCHAARGVSGTAPDYVEVVQMATRLENPSTGRSFFLDIVVRNNSPGSWLDEIWIYTSVINQ
jgi:hypothetical protein